MGWGQGKPKQMKRPLPDSMKIDVNNDAEAAAIGAYLYYRENLNRIQTHRNIDLTRGYLSVIRGDEAGKNAVAMGARVTAEFDPVAFEEEAPEIKVAVDKALAYALS